MALRAKKDVKKSSYYVWFLGAQEARAARGAHHALDALARLERRALLLDPFKVTLQISSKGLKIVQNVEARGKARGGRTVKHFLPADSVTEARSRGDAVVCVLLLYNPATRCPLHAHAYRCDSEQTAQALCAQLRTLAGLGSEEDDVDGPVDPVEVAPLETRETRLDPRDPRENRIENRERMIDPRDIRADSRERSDPREGRVDSRERIDPRMDREERVVNSRERDVRLDPRDDRMQQRPSNFDRDQRPAPVETRLAPEQEIAAERLAAELRRRLGGREPLLLPPRDYDTMRRGPAAAAPQAGRRLGRGVVGSSAGSSGIGSDLAPSPDRPHTSSEEDWGESTAYMLHEGFDVSVSPTRRPRSPSPAKASPRSGGHSTGSVSPKDRFNVAKEKFMNLEREKIEEEIEKRAQMRRNLNNALARGPLSPTELKANRRSGNKWDDDDDIIIERRPEMPRAVARSDPRDIRNSRNAREHSRDARRDPRDQRDSREYREARDSRDLRDPLDMREFRDVKPFREPRDGRDHREYKDSREREYKETKDPRDPRYKRDIKDPRDMREYREPKDAREVREYREPRDAKYVPEYRESREHSEMRGVEDLRDRRDSRERTPQLENRYYEYKGDRNDKYFDNRYNNKPDSRSDDEGVESEKQFEEIRYVPHVEIPRKRDADSRMIKAEPVRKEPVRDGRIELLEERQRQMESRRLPRPGPPEDRYDKSLEMQRRPQPENRDWEVLRRSYAEADRPRRDARARHSYAEPVARTRVGMATVAPF